MSAVRPSPWSKSVAQTAGCLSNLDSPTCSQLSCLCFSSRVMTMFKSFSVFSLWQSLRNSANLPSPITWISITHITPNAMTRKTHSLKHHIALSRTDWDDIVRSMLMSQWKPILCYSLDTCWHFTRLITLSKMMQDRDILWRLMKGVMICIKTSQGTYTCGHWLQLIHLCPIDSIHCQQ